MTITIRNARFGRFFMSAIRVPAFLLLSNSLLAATPEFRCPSGPYDEKLKIRYVIDGDTVVLDDGKKLRLIGIDSPELGRDGRQDEPWALEARDYLTGLVLKNQGVIHVIYDNERQDRYQRLLGHLYTSGGESIQAMILARGLATPLTIPPNLGYLGCYRRHARLARDDGTGIWSGPQYVARDVNSLSGRERGFHVVSGVASRIGESRSSIWINLGPSLAIRITRNDLKYFSDLDIYALKGKNIQVQGEIYNRDRQLRIRIRHPADIELID